MRSINTPAAIALFVLAGLGSARAQSGFWEIRDSAFGPYYYYGVECASSERCFVIGSNGVNSVIRRTVDGGLSWHTVWIDTVWRSDTEFHRPREVMTLATKGSTVVVPMDSCYVGVSRDGGDSWHTIRLGNDWKSLVAMTQLDADRGLIIERPNTIWRTTDGWRTWDTLLLPPALFDTVVYWAVAWPDEETILLLGTNATTPQERFIARSDDAGATWRASPAPPNHQRMHFFDDMLGWTYGIRRGASGTQPRDVIDRTTDGGLTWTNQLDSVIMTAGALFELDTYDGVHLLCTGIQGKILRSNDGGVVWTQEFAHLDSNAQSDMYVAYPSVETAIIATSRAGLLKWISSAGIEAASDGFAHSISPNPATSGENIRLHLRGGSHGATFAVAIYAIDGRRVEELRADIGHEPQTLELPSLRSGSYLVQITSGRERLTLPLIVW